MRAGKAMLFEGAQGTLLDIDHGTYPYVTSSNAHGRRRLHRPRRRAASAIDGVLGVAKAYTTRVGEGPLPTELLGEMGQRLRETGSEYGAVDRPAAPLRLVRRRRGALRRPRQRPRRAGADQAGRARRHRAELQVCTAYRCGGGTLRELPSDIAQLAACEPVYETVPGWTASTTGVRRYADLPAARARYIEALEEVSGVPAALISTGSDREDTIVRDDGVVARWLKR